MNIYGISAITSVQTSAASETQPAKIAPEEALSNDKDHILSMINDRSFGLGGCINDTYNMTKLFLDKQVSALLESGKFSEAYESIKTIMQAQSSVDGLSLISIADETIKAKDGNILDVPNRPKDPWFRINLAMNFARACSGYARRLEEKGDNGQAMSIIGEGIKALLEAEMNIPSYSLIGNNKTTPVDISAILGQDRTARIETLNKTIESSKNADIKKELSASFSLIEAQLLGLESQQTESSLLNKEEISSEDILKSEKFFASLFDQEKTPKINGETIIDFFDKLDPKNPQNHNNPWLKANSYLGLSRSKIMLAGNESDPAKKAAILKESMATSNALITYLLSYYLPVGSKVTSNATSGFQEIYKKCMGGLDQKQKHDLSIIYILANSQVASATKQLSAISTDDADKTYSESLALIRANINEAFVLSGIKKDEISPRLVSIIDKDTDLNMDFFRKTDNVSRMLLGID